MLPNDSLQAHQVRTPDEIKKPGDWCIWNILDHGKRIVMRCPICSAEGMFMCHNQTFFNRVKIFFNIIPIHPGVLACPQNRQHQFFLKNNLWKIVTAK